RAQLESGADAFQVTIRNYMKTREGHIWDRAAQPNPAANRQRWPESAPYPSYVEHQNVRLFRRHPDIYFVGRLHESVGPRVKASGLRLGESRGRIHHFGLTLAADAQAAKNLRYLELARRKAEDQAEDAQAHFELGVMLFDVVHQDGEALRAIERALRLNPKLGVAWFYAGAALLRLGHPAEALAFLQQAVAAGQRSALLEEMLGDALYGSGRYDEAAQHYRGQGLASKLGLAELRSGRAEAGLRHLRAAVSAQPAALEHHDRLIAAYAHLEAWDAAETAILARNQRFPDRPDGPARLAALQHERQTRGETKARFAAGR
ncbi:MAG: tetratricopeptide repeat protein, partial [Terriglobales bacterium]